MSRNPFCVVIDTETGGLDPRLHALLEVSLIVVDDQLTMIEDFCAKIQPRPGFEIQPRAAEINGYNPADWTIDKAHPWDQADDIYVRFIDQWFPSGAPPAFAHNADFDKKFVHYHLPNLSKKLGNWECTVKAAKEWRDKSRRPGSNKLGELVKEAGYVPTDAHRASADAHSCLAVMRWFAGMDPRGGVIAA